MTKTEKLKIFVEHANKELQRYNSTKKEIHLYQSSEKIWGAYNLLVEIFAKKDLRSHYLTTQYSWKLIERKRIPKTLYENADSLHSYFYEGRRDPKVVVPEIKSTLKMLRTQIRNLRR